MHPHTYVRLPNGDVLATFQYHGGHNPDSEGGGLVEFDQQGKLVRSGSAMDASAKDELIRPYSLVVVPALDRIVSTNNPMHEHDGGGRTVQVWRLSDLKLLRTVVLPPGRINHYWVQTLFSAHAVAVYDTSDLSRVHEVSRVTFDNKQGPHWMAADTDNRRIVSSMLTTACSF